METWKPSNEDAGGREEKRWLRLIAKLASKSNAVVNIKNGAKAITYFVFVLIFKDCLLRIGLALSRCALNDTFTRKVVLYRVSAESRTVTFD